MSGIATAVVGAAVVGGVASNMAANKAAKAQQSAADQATALQREQYDQTRTDQAPWRQVGTNALNELALRLGIGGAGGAIGGGAGGQRTASQALGSSDLIQYGASNAPTYNPELYASNPAYRKAWDDLLQEHIGWAGQGYRFDSDASKIESALRQRLQAQSDQEQAANPVEQNPLYGSLMRNFQASDFEADPGYQFRLGEGQKQIESSAAARGGLLSGAAAKALTKYNQNFASNEYSNVYNRFRANQTDQFNRLASLAGVGQTATNATQQAGQQFATSAGNNALYAGSARASGYGNVANSINSGLGTAANALVNFGGGSTYGNNPYGNYSATPSPVVDYYSGVNGVPLA